MFREIPKYSRFVATLKLFGCKSETLFELQTELLIWSPEISSRRPLQLVTSTVLTSAVCLCWFDDAAADC